MALFLFFLLAAVVLGLVGVVVKGLLFLLAIGIVVFLLDLVFIGWRSRRGLERRRTARTARRGERRRLRDLV